MTERERFCAIQARRGYEVENLGLITFLHSVTREGWNYTAVWFWNQDGSLNREMRPSWSISH